MVEIILIWIGANYMQILIFEMDSFNFIGGLYEKFKREIRISSIKRLFST